MTVPRPQNWSTIKALFREAVELPPENRATFLAHACGADEELRAEVEGLLAAHEDERPFLDVVPIAGGARVLSAALEDAEGLVTCLAPGTRIGQYEVLEPLGSGGMGDVYRARDTKLDRSVALKIVLDSTSGQTADRVLREARAASALNHPNVCTVYETGEFDGQSYLAMEYIAGQPLDSLIPPEGFDAGDVVHYGVQIADALAHAHEHGVIHHDLKAANVVVTPQRRAKVLDFGISKRMATVTASAAAGVLTEGGRVTAAATARSGTLAYMAPELLRGRTADARSDIWALGVLLYEIAVGRRPFGGDAPSQMASAIMSGSRPAFPAKVPSGLRAVIVRCLARDAADRFQHASEVLAALEACSRVDQTTASGFRRRRSVLTVSLAATLLVAAYAMYQWRGGVRPSVADSTRMSLGVVPFQVASGAEDVGFLAIGVPHGVGSRLALVRSMRVRTMLVAGKKHERPSVVGRGLGVDYVLTGTIQKDETGFRITPRLARMPDGVTVWTTRFTRSSGDLLRLDDEIARGIIAALRVQVSAEERESLDRQHPRNPEVYRLYLRGRAELAQNKRSNTESAVAAFQAAADLDEKDALAHAGLAMASAKMHHFFASETEVLIWYKRAHEAAQRALELEFDLAETHEALAAVYRSTEFDWLETIAESAQALARNRGLDQPHLFRASAFMHLGLFDRAHSEAAAAMEINAANMAEPLRVQGAAATYRGRYEVAVSLLEQASATSDEPAEWNLAYAYYNAGRKAEAEAMLRRIRGRSVRSQRRAQATLASFLAAERETQEAMKLIDAVLAGSYMDHHVAYALGAAYAQLGRPKEALEWLANARSSGFPCYPWFTSDPLLMPLRQHPAFQIFLDEFKQSWDTRKAQFAADR
jgi:serine/threonine protein kinase/tetratricopeptide (TPR) repeat protein